MPYYDLDKTNPFRWWWYSGGDHAWVEVRRAKSGFCLGLFKGSGAHRDGRFWTLTFHLGWWALMFNGRPH